MSVDRSRLTQALALARWAPSAHNTQPWRVALDADTLLLTADESRWLRVGDPERRDLELSIGAMARALEIAFAEQGLAFVRAESPGVTRFTLSDGEALSPLATLLRQRATSRLRYAQRAPAPEVLERLSAAARAGGLTLHAFAADGTERARIERLVKAAMRESWLSAPARAELNRWTRFDFEGALRSRDGLASCTFGLSVLEELALKPLLNGGLWRALEKPFLAPFVADSLAEAEAATARAAPWLVVLTGDRPRRELGGALLDVWLEVTRERLYLQPLSVVLDRRGWDLSRLLKVPADMLVACARIGHGTPPIRSGRLEVEAFARL